MEISLQGQSSHGLAERAAVWAKQSKYYNWRKVVKPYSLVARNEVKLKAVMAQLSTNTGAERHQYLVV